jgi:tetratricopeptide (TPR) repeat protein
MEPHGVALDYIARARLSIARGDLRGAIESLRWALSGDPLSAQAHALLALCLIDTKRLHAAEHEAVRALELEPELRLSHLAMAHVRFAQHRLRDAEGHLDEVQRLDPEDQAAFRLRASIAGARGRPHEVVSVLERARSVDPEDAETRISLGRAYIEVNDIPHAEEISMEVLREHPESHAGLVLRGGVLLLKGQTRDAREHALMALRQNGESSQALRLLVAVKARSSPVLGLWWRYNAWMSARSASSRVLVLLGMFVAYRLSLIVTAQQGLEQVNQVVMFVWLGFVAYSWAGPAMFQRMLRRELASVKLKKDF